MSMEEDEEIQELDAEEQQGGEQPQQGDGQRPESTAEARAQQTGKKRARSAANSSTNPSNSRKPEVWKDFKFTRGFLSVYLARKKFVADSESGTSSTSRHVKK
jgi:hypothetical protein